MLEYGNPQYGYALLAIPFFLLLYWTVAAWRRSALKKFGDLTLVAKLIPHQPKFKRQVKLLALIAAWCALTLALVNPRQGARLEKVKRKGADVVVALDISGSMLAEDLKPNRLERAKQFVANLTERMSNDRIALIVFAGNAYLQMPLTIDYAAAKMFLSNVSTELAPTQGTAIAEAVEMAGTLFTGEGSHKAVIVISDGEDHKTDAVETARKAAAEGIVIHTVGVGTPRGAPIPVYAGGRQAAYKKDSNGSIVLSRLNEEVLQKIAGVSGGDYFRLTHGSEQLMELLASIAAMEKKEIEEKVFTEYNDKFQYPLAAALLLLIAELFISTRKSKWLSRILFYDEEAAHP